MSRLAQTAVPLDQYEYVDLGENFSLIENYRFYLEDYDLDTNPIDSPLPAKGNENILDQVNLSTTSRAQTATTAAQADTARCSISFPVVILFLVVTGGSASMLGTAELILNRKKCRHFRNFLHLLATNVFILFSLSFVAAERFHMGLRFEDVFYKMLVVSFHFGQTACAFHLTHLVFIRCKEVVRGKNSCIMKADAAIRYVLWFVSLATAWPPALYEDVLADVTRGGNTPRSTGGSVYIRAHTIVSFVIPSVICSACFLVAIVDERKKETQNETRLVAMRNVKEVTVLFALFSACWFPYKAMELVMLQRSTVSNCNAWADAFLCNAAAFSTIMPIAHYTLSKTKNSKWLAATVSTEC